MTNFVDTFVESSDETVMREFCLQFRNVAGPEQGRAATTVEDEEGNIVEIPQVGDPTKWYALVRTTASIDGSSATLPPEITTTTETEVIHSLCGCPFDLL